MISGRVLLERDDRNDRTIVRMRNPLGRWLPLRDENGQIVDLHREAMELRSGQSAQSVIAKFQNVDAIFEGWWE